MQSVIDSIKVEDLSQDAQLRAQLISEDRRSFKEKKSYLLNDFDFDHPITLRLFTECDIVQVLFVDES